MNFFYDVFVNMFVGIALSGLTVLAYNRKYLKCLFLSHLFYARKDIRMSISYLYRIKIDNEYLLIKGKHIEQLQPIGGVFKYYPSFNHQKEKLGIKDEIKKNFYEQDDLRIIVKGKNIVKTIKWFNNGVNRECSAYREFYEEIIKPGYLDSSSLNNIEIEYLKQIPPKISFSKHFNMYEVLLFNIYELRLGKLEIDQIKELVEQANSPLVLVDKDAINRECVKLNGKDYKIGAHTQHII